MQYIYLLLISVSAFTFTSTLQTKDIDSNSMDYWIRNIPPRSVIRIVYFESTNDFSFHALYNIPVIFVPILDPKARSGQKPAKRPRKKSNFRNSSLKFMKAECYFSILYYKRTFTYSPVQKSYTENVAGILQGWINGRSFSQQYLTEQRDNHPKPISTITHCLILVHGNKFDVSSISEELIFTKVFHVILVQIKHSSNYAYMVLCGRYLPATKIPQEVDPTQKDIISSTFLVSCTLPDSSFRVKFILGKDPKDYDPKDFPP